MAEATAHYQQRETELGTEVMREVERQVMLRIIDQRWREHLEEMDYLKEGINLRAMGQKDPLTEWQREGYEMFGAMMKAIAQDFVRYVMHVQVVQKEAPDARRAEGAQHADLVERRRACRDRLRPGARDGRGRGRSAASGGTCAGADEQADDRREGRLREDAAQRAVPVRLRQEVQAVPRRCLNGGADARLHRRSARRSSPARRGVRVPQGR